MGSLGAFFLCCERVCIIHLRQMLDATNPILRGFFQNIFTWICKTLSKGKSCLSILLKRRSFFLSEVHLKDLLGKPHQGINFLLDQFEASWTCLFVRKSSYLYYYLKNLQKRPQAAGVFSFQHDTNKSKQLLRRIGSVCR